jgi:dCMP deaminase
MLQRVSWEEYALNLAKCAKIRSEDVYRQVGACAIAYNNRVLGVAYNGLKSGKNVDSNFWEDRELRRPYMVHAETNLLSLFKRDECKILAVTLLPCDYCARMIAAWNIPTVVYEEEYEHSKQSKDIFKFYDINLIKLTI